MNADLYAAVVEALGPQLVKEAHRNRLHNLEAGNNFTVTGARLNVRAFLKHGRNARDRQRPGPTLVGEIRNCVTLLCRGAVRDFQHDDKTDVITIAFHKGEVMNGYVHKRYGRYDTRSEVSYKVLRIGDKEYAPDYFNLISFRVPEETEQPCPPQS